MPLDNVCRYECLISLRSQLRNLDCSVSSVTSNGHSRSTNSLAECCFLRISRVRLGPGQHRSPNPVLFFWEAANSLDQIAQRLIAVRFPRNRQIKCLACHLTSFAKTYSLARAGCVSAPAGSGTVLPDARGRIKLLDGNPPTYVIIAFD